MGKIESFNKIILDFIGELKKIFPNETKFAIYEKVCDKQLQKNKIFLIDSFILHILPHKEQIDAGDDEYFMSKDMDGVDDKTVKHLLNFKDLWTKLSDSNRVCVKEYMKILCEISAEYFIENDNNRSYEISN